MISAPTTEVLILNCCQELLEGVLPGLTDETAKVRLHMVESVLRAAAVRSAHEIAWMREESVAMSTFARAVIAAVPETGEVEAALLRVDSEPARNLHLDQVASAYRRASDAFSLAMEAARRAGAEHLMDGAIAVLDVRVENERSVRGRWLSTAGR